MFHAEQPSTEADPLPLYFQREHELNDGQPNITAKWVASLFIRSQIQIAAQRSAMTIKFLQWFSSDPTAKCWANAFHYIITLSCNIPSFKCIFTNHCVGYW
jgi:hypothetical protein